jgi:CheY-like chemotaxis protein
VTVDTAENGMEGVQKFLDSAPGDYDAILMDIRMPVMNGIEAANRSACRIGRTRSPFPSSP